MLASLVAGILLALSSSPTRDPGLWEPPFNHVVPDGWKIFHADWDGEPLSPYRDPQDPHRFMAAHLALIPVGPHRGRVLALNWMRKGHIHGQQHWSIVDPAADPATFFNASLPMPEQDVSLFCAGHAWTPEGALLVVGGDRFEGEEKGANRLCYRFDPRAPTGNTMWVREADMHVERWYPTVTAMGTDAAGHDLMLVSGGLLDPDNALANKTYEAFDPGPPPGFGRWQRDLTAGGRPYFDGPPVPCTDSFGIYPRDFVLTTGQKFTAGMASLSYRAAHPPFGTAQAPQWTVQAQGREFCRWYGSAFLVPDIGESGADRVLRLGGALVRWDNPSCLQQSMRVASATTEYCDAALPADDPSWGWHAGPPLAYERNNPNSTLLPDGTALVTGGRRDQQGMFKTSAPVRYAELFNETPFRWRTAAQARTRRGYHSAALLLPDGRVLTGGGEQREKDYEIYRPPYLTDGSARPVIVGAPETLAAGYAEEHALRFEPLPGGVAIERVVLMAPGSVTHHFDNQQRYVGLDIVSVSGTQVRFTTPPDTFQAPRGYYMLFLVTAPQRPGSRGTPSRATWVKLE